MTTAAHTKALYLAEPIGERDRSTRVTGIAPVRAFQPRGGLGIGVQLADGRRARARTGRRSGRSPQRPGVTAAVVHNFGWHVRWTWRDRMGPGVSRLAAFARFAGANGVISLVGSVLLLPVVMGLAGLPAIPANLVTIAACGLLNYWIGGRVCFPQIRSKKCRLFRHNLWKTDPSPEPRFRRLGVKSSPGLMNRSRSKLYCLS